MNIHELHIDFKIKFDKIDTLQKKDFTDAEIDWLLNEAQEQFFRNHYKPNNLSRSGFEVTQDRIDELSNLHIKYPLQKEILPIKIEENLYEVDLANLDFPYYHLTYLEVKDNCGYKRAKHVSSDDYSNSIKNPFYNDLPIYNFGRSTNNKNSSIYIYFPIESVKLSYLRRPSKVNKGTYEYFDKVLPEQGLEFPDYTHPMIVDLAVTEAVRIMSNNFNDKIITND